MELLEEKILDLDSLTAFLRVLIYSSAISHDDEKSKPNIIIQTRRENKYPSYAKLTLGFLLPHYSLLWFNEFANFPISSESSYGERVVVVAEEEEEEEEGTAIKAKNWINNSGTGAKKMVGLSQRN